MTISPIVRCGGRGAARSVRVRCGRRLRIAATPAPARVDGRTTTSRSVLSPGSDTADRGSRSTVTREGRPWSGKPRSRGCDVSKSAAWSPHRTRAPVREGHGPSPSPGRQPRRPPCGSALRAGAAAPWRRRPPRPWFAARSCRRCARGDGPRCGSRWTAPRLFDGWSSPGGQAQYLDLPCREPRRTTGPGGPSARCPEHQVAGGAVQGARVRLTRQVSDGFVDGEGVPMSPWLGPVRTGRVSPVSAVPWSSTPVPAPETAGTCVEGPGGGNRSPESRRVP